MKIESLHGFRVAAEMLTAIEEKNLNDILSSPERQKELSELGYDLYLENTYNNLHTLQLFIRDSKRYKMEYHITFKEEKEVLFCYSLSEVQKLNDREYYIYLNEKEDFLEEVQTSCQELLDVLVC